MPRGDQPIVLVVIYNHQDAARLIRAGLRHAAGKPVQLVALSVESFDFLGTHDPESGIDAQYLVQQTKTVAGMAGVSIHYVRNRSVLRAVEKFVAEKCAPRKLHSVILGQPQRTWWEKIAPPLEQRLRVRLGPEVEILPVSVDFMHTGPVWQRVLPKLRLLEIGYAILAVLAASFAVELFEIVLSDSETPQIRNKSMIYLISSVFIAGRFGLLPGLLTAILGFLSLNAVYISPYFDMSLVDTNDIINLTIFLGSALIIGLFVSSGRRETIELAGQANQLHALFNLHRLALTRNSRDEVVDVLHKEISLMLSQETVLFMPRLMNANTLEAYPSTTELSEHALEALNRCWAENRPTGVGTSEFMHVGWRFEPLLTLRRELGVLAIRVPDVEQINVSWVRLVVAIAAQVAIILEYIDLDQMMEQSRMHAEREKLRSMLLSSVSHDLKTPLASIIGSISVVQTMAHQLQPTQRDVLIDNALQEARRLDSFITNILDMTRLESGEMRFKQAWFDVKTTVQETTRRLTDCLQKHQVRLHGIPEDIELYADGVMTGQILQNLLDNAAKYTPPKTKIDVSFMIEDDVAKLVVRDHGKGILAERLDIVFDKYARLHKEDRQVAGTGLGLAIAKAVMEGQGGKITVRNHPDGGAEFTLVFPQWRKRTYKAEAVS